MNQPNQCGTCAALHEEDPNPQAVGVQTFTCHAHPPQIVSLGGASMVAIWPPTRPEGWCREWSPRQKTAGTVETGDARARIGQGHPLG